MKQRTYILELPLYVAPTAALKQLVEDLGSPISTNCTITYYADGKLTFFAHELVGKNNVIGRKVTFKPFHHKQTEQEFINNFVNIVGKFVSLFHCFSAPSTDRRKIYLKFSSDVEDLKKYGDSTKMVLKLTALALDYPTSKLYENFSKCVDPNKEVLEVRDF